VAGKKQAPSACLHTPVGILSAQLSLEDYCSLSESQQTLSCPVACNGQLGERSADNCGSSGGMMTCCGGDDLMPTEAIHAEAGRAIEDSSRRGGRGVERGRDASLPAALSATPAVSVLPSSAGLLENDALLKERERPGRETFSVAAQNFKVNRGHGAGKDMGPGGDVMDMDTAVSVISSVRGRSSVWTGDFPPTFIGALMAKSVIVPGSNGLIYALHNLSWFWVPVIIMALHIRVGAHDTDMLQHIDNVLNATGALFTMQELVSTTRSMLLEGQFRLMRQEILVHSRQDVYITASAQDRLRDKLNAARPDLMSAVSDWINHLYYLEILYLNQGAGQPGAYEADSWIAHSYRDPSTHMTVNVGSAQLGMQLYVNGDGIQRWRVSTTILRSELLSSDGHITSRSMIHRATRNTLLRIRLQLMAQVAAAGVSPRI
jgi:hypothetical protein